MREIVCVYIYIYIYIFIYLHRVCPQLCIYDVRPTDNHVGTYHRARNPQDPVSQPASEQVRGGDS